MRKILEVKTLEDLKVHLWLLKLLLGMEFKYVESLPRLLVCSI